MKLKDAEAKVTAMRNNISSRGLDNYYGKENDSHVRESFESNESQTSILCRFLEATKVPKYVKLALFLKEIDRNFNIAYSTEKTQAEYFLKDIKNKYSVSDKKAITIAKEFKQIQRRAKIASNKAYRQINRYKDVKNFYKNGRISLCSELEKQPFYNNSRYGVLSSDIQEVTKFFDDCGELSFLNRSKITKKVIR